MLKLELMSFTYDWISYEAWPYLEQQRFDKGQLVIKKEASFNKVPLFTLGFFIYMS